jgi:hypothetical protein
VAELTKFQREIISRATIGVIALALLYGGWRCIAAGVEWSREFRERNPDRRLKTARRSSGRSSGAGYAYLAGGLLILCGGVAGLAAVVPSETFGRIMKPGSKSSLWDNPSSDNPRGRW